MTLKKSKLTYYVVTEAKKKFIDKTLVGNYFVLLGTTRLTKSC